MSEVIRTRKMALKAWAKSAAKKLRRRGRWVEAAQLEHEAAAVKNTRTMKKPARILLAHFQRLHPPLSPTGVWNTRTVNRLKRWMSISPKATAKKLLLNACAVSYAKRAIIRYSYPYHNAQRWSGIVRRIKPPNVPPYADCSSWVIWVYWVCGFPDPAGTGYRWGTSETIYYHCRAHGKFIKRGQEQAGDIVVYRGGVGHAELVTARGTVLTNGQDIGPVYRPIGAHSGQMYICRFKPFL